MIKFSTARKAIAILANVSLLFNSFVPFLLAVQPAYAQSSEVVAPTIEYSQSANKININVNTSEKVAYQLFYKTDKIDAIAGNDLALGNFYLGTCSASVCLPQNISRGILKIESGSEFHSQFFTLENNVLAVIKESDSSQSDLTNEENDFLENISQWTFEKVELNKEYVAPQNNGVKLTFTKLPENSGNIKIEEITLTSEQIEQSRSLSDKAYDITSDMVDGTFTYNLSLPIPESAKGQNVDIKFAEEISQINSAQTADNTTETNSIATTTNLDHFTIFFAVVKTTDKNLVGKETFNKGETVYINTIVFDLSKTKIIIKNSNGDIVKQYNETYSPAYQYTYKIQLSDSIGEYSINIGSYQIVGGKWYNPEWGWVWENNVDTFTVKSVCSDNFIDSDEQCDNGILNGQICTPGYNSTCNYCTNECKTSTIDNLDKTAPSVPTNGTPNNSIIPTNNFDFNWNASTDDSSTITYEFQSSLNPTQTGGVLTTGLWSSNILPSNMIHSSGAQDGAWYWQVRAIDAAGNKSGWSEIWKVTLDTQKPSKPSNLSFSTTNGTVLGCNTITNQYTIVAKWDASTDANFSNYEYQSFNPTTGWIYPAGNIGDVLLRTGTFSAPVGEGTYGFAVRAVDKAGNVSDWTSLDLANSCKITYDKTPPVITLGVYTTAPTNQDITVTATTNEGSLNIGSTTFTANGSFDFIATDSAGNVTTKTVIITNIDKNIPEIPTAIFTANGINVLSNGYTVFKNFKFNLSSSSDTTRYQLKYWNNIDDSTFKINKPWNPTNLSGYSSSLGVYNDNFSQGEGTHYFIFSACDAANNCSAYSTVPFTVTYDKTAPTLLDKTNFGDVWYKTNQISTFNFTDENGIISGNNPTCDINTEGTQQTCSINLNVCDTAGNCNIETIISNGANIDKTNPTITASINPVTPDGQNSWYWTQPEITLTGTDTNLDKIEYQWDSQIEGSWTTYSVAVKPLTEGNHDLYYRAIDKAGNVSTIGSKNIRWDKTDLEYGPQNLSANPNPTSGSTSKIKWEMGKDNTGIDKYEIQWKLNDNNQSLSYSKTVGAGTTEVEIDQLIEGRWTVKVIAFDQSGRTKDNSIDLIVDRTGPVAPTLQVTSTGTGTASLAWNAIDDAKDYIIWYGSVQGVHQYGARVGNVTSYTVKGLGTGNYYFIVKAVDAAQNQSNDSNEVNTGNIVGATGSTPGQPAQGFSPEVLGASTEEITPTVTPAIELGDVLGSSITKEFSNWWWLLLLGIIPLYVVGKKISKKKK